MTDRRDGEGGEAGVIGLLTDFGTADVYVGVMKGVIAGIAPHATTVDLTHDVAPQDVRGGAFSLLASCRYFPSGTHFCCVVDPGVGGQRRAVAVELRDGERRYLVVCPDNGLLTPLLHLAERAVAIENREYQLPAVSATFHGRDVFAPATAHLAAGVRLEELGTALAPSDLVRLPWPEPQDRGEELLGEVIHIDRFGNLVTNITSSHLLPAPAGDRATREDRRAGAQGAHLGQGAIGDTERPAGPYEPRAQKWLVALAGAEIANISQTFSSVAVGEPVAYLGSSGFVEVAVREGNAARQLEAGVGDEVLLRSSGRGA